MSCSLNVACQVVRHRHSMSHFQLFEDFQDNEHDESWPAQDLTSGPERGHSFPLGLPPSDPASDCGSLRDTQRTVKATDKWTVRVISAY